MKEKPEVTAQVRAWSRALSRAREAIRQLAGVDIQKTMWGSPAGKKRIADRLAKLLPAHTTYVEPFAGSAAVFFEKEPAEVEVLNDLDPEIVEAYRIIKRLGPDQLTRLRQMKWVGNAETFKQLVGTHPKNDLEKLHRFLYLSHFSYGKMRGKSFSPSSKGAEAKTVDRLEKHAPRLKGVRIHCGDYERIVRKYDSAKTVFYLDPPYPGYNVEVGEGEFDEERFLRVLKSIKGKFLVTYGVRGELPGRFEQEGFTVKRIRPARTIGSMRGVNELVGGEAEVLAAHHGGPGCQLGSNSKGIEPRPGRFHLSRHARGLGVPGADGRAPAPAVEPDDLCVGEGPGASQSDPDHGQRPGGRGDHRQGDARRGAGQRDPGLLAAAGLLKGGATMDFVRARPPRCVLVNVETGEHLECLFNPTQLTEKWQVQWNRLVVPGLSHQPLQFQSTGNRQLANIEFYLDRFFASEQPSAPDILQFRDFLGALTVPGNGSEMSAPPRTLLIWPGFVTIEAVLTEVEFQYRQFALDGSVLVYTATCSLEVVGEPARPTELIVEGV